jgi:hypothetical protein
MSLDAGRVPQPLVPLLPLAEKWGSGDDLERSSRVERASNEQLLELLEAVNRCQNELFDWLAGPESYSADPTKEYIAFSDLAAAFDYAKVLLRRRKDRL